MPKPISIKTTYLSIVLVIASIVTAIALGYSVFYGLVFSNLLLYGVLLWNGYSHGKILSMMLHGLKSAWLVLLIMTMIGALIGLWLAGGTIPTMMYFGFHYLSKVNFILATFFITSAISMILGTSLGTISTIGMALVGIGKGLNIPLSLLIGTIVSGSYLGDRSSPMSSSANLTAAITGTNLTDNLKHMMVTMGPIYIICTVFYYQVGKSYTIVPGGSSEVLRLQELLALNFDLSNLTLIPPLAILIMAVLKFPMIKNLATGLLLTFLILVLKGTSGLSEIISTVFWGFHPTDKEVASVLSGGGLVSMKYVLLIIGASTSLNGMMDETGMIEPLMERFISGIRNIGSLIFRTSFLSLTIAILTCNQTLAVLIPGKFLQGIYKKNRISKNTLARTIADTGIVLVPLIPWNVNAIVITAIFGISVSTFAPYSLLCYLTPVITVLFGYMGIIKYSNDDDSTRIREAPERC